jgi:hypothetical protein
MLGEGEGRWDGGRELGLGTEERLLYRCEGSGMGGGEDVINATEMSALTWWRRNGYWGRWGSWATAAACQCGRPGCYHGLK